MKTLNVLVFATILISETMRFCACYMSLVALEIEANKGDIRVQEFRLVSVDVPCFSISLMNVFSTLRVGKFK